MEMDAAHVASRAVTHDLCERIRPGHRWDDGAPGRPLADAMARLVATLGRDAFGVATRAEVTQGYLGGKLRGKAVEAWRGESQPADGVRLSAHSAHGAGTRYELTPSRTFDMNISACEFADNVATLLGVDVLDEGSACPLCAAPLDAKGTHCLSCMSGGDATFVHNAIRDVFYDYSARGGLRPELEAAGLLDDPGAREARQAADEHRPADVLVIPHITLARFLPDGSRAVRADRVCFDFALINALGPSHWADTAMASGLAAESYDAQKRQHNRTEERCREHGLQFRPVVFEAQGGMSKGADAAVRALAAAVASREGREPATVRREMLHRIAVIVARGSAARIARRRSKVSGARASWASAARLTWAADHEEP